MRLLMITRKVDRRDTSPAGFTYRWVDEISSKLKAQSSKLFVICLEKGDTSGLDNTEVYSLGKEKGYGKLRKFLNFQKLASGLIRQVDGVFCHQNPEYTILIAPWAKLFGKKIVSWYTYKEVNWKLHLVNLLTNKILTASEESCRLKNRKKVEVVGHGIDVEKFKVQNSKLKTAVQNSKFTILSVGRISPVKDYETLIKAMDILVNQKGKKNLEVQIIGGPGLKEQETYLEKLKNLVKDKKLEKYTKFLGPISHHQIVPYYQNCDLFINLSQTGSIDKAVLEAMACQKLVLISNEAFVSLLDNQRLIFQEKNTQELVQKIIDLISLSSEEKQAIGQRLRNKVVQGHNLSNLINKIIDSFIDDEGQTLARRGSDPHKYLLFYSIFILAFLLRVWGIDYGLPYFFVGDEQSLVAGALRMAQLKTLLPVFHPDEFRLLYYPPLMSYIYLVLLTPFILIRYLFGSWEGLAAFGNALILNPGFIWLAARIINALIGLATIYLIYLIGRKIFNHWIGLMASLFLSLSFFHIQLSHFTRHWVPALFFVYLIVFLTFSIYKNPQRKYYLWTGIWAGLAFGVSYITAIVLLLVLFIHFFAGQSSLLQKLRDKNLWLMLIIFILVSSVFVLLHPQEFFRILFGEDSTLAQSKNFIGFLSSFVYYLKVLFFYEPMILIFSLIGWLILWFHSKKDWLIFLFWPVLYMTCLYLFFHHEARYIVFIVPWLSLLAGYALYLIFKKLSAVVHSQLVAALILLLIFVYPLIMAIQYDNLLSQKDTRILAKEWAERNISTENRIITHWSGIKLVATKESILLQREIDEKSLRTDDKVLLSLEPEQYPRPAFDILPLHFIGHQLPNNLNKYIHENNYQYFIVQYWQRGELNEQDESIIREGQLIKRFDAGLSHYSFDIHGNLMKPISIIFSLERLGPIVEIYKL